MIEQIIANFCAPTLAGIKPGSLVSCYKNRIPNLNEQINRLNCELNCKDIFFEKVCECDKRVLLLVYRKKQLADYIFSPEIQSLLKEYGYGNYTKLYEYINHLKSRLKTQSEFPHEIGAFLGYPADDIYSFINHRNEGCLLVGGWRVYHDAESAKRLFERYKKCRCAIVKKLIQGKTLAQIFCAA